MFKMFMMVLTSAMAVYSVVQVLGYFKVQNTEQQNTEQQNTEQRSRVHRSSRKQRFILLAMCCLLLSISYSMDVMRTL
ncbi:hypothetical protein E2K93_16670 [Thalassotalea sp. HSM 43]|uniref:hypothetical protein n=1 Tax=Thalassotalea sp. HSM 43 TaxID=2552945 RepID=UPI00108194F4|nr:hypothetical protein [Thalassotalea sp. HSM 43]QBY05895.1 hypothetical protein E2K93_16670 [Thalassotalea sp. HSM 43]